MSVIYPFRALRPVAARAAQVASVPYDVLNTEEARALASENPLSFLHVSRPEIDMPEGTDIYSDAAYAKAAENFGRLIKECSLEMEAEPSLYLYRLTMGDHTQTGVAACFSVDEYDQDLIRKHERTRRDKEDDRTRHILELKAQTGPVFLTYRADRRIDALVEAETARNEPLYDFTAEDGVHHTLWRVRVNNDFVKAFRAVPLLYIADGHHRAASASRARAALRDQNADHTGNEEYNRFLAVVFPSDQMQILPYNRVVKDLHGLSKEEFLNKVAENFGVTEMNESARARSVPMRALFHMYLDGTWYELTLKANQNAQGAMKENTNPVSSLDVSILQDQLLDPILGIKDVRTDKRIDFVGGIRGAKELERLVDENRAAVAFSLSPTTVDDLLNVSDAGSIMPPKSTWFEPKLRDALLIHCI